jgi:hypothetical protein
MLPADPFLGEKAPLGEHRRDVRHRARGQRRRRAGARPRAQQAPSAARWTPACANSRDSRSRQGSAASEDADPTRFRRNRRRHLRDGCPKSSCRRLFLRPLAPNICIRLRNHDDRRDRSRARRHSTATGVAGNANVASGPCAIATLGRDAVGKGSWPAGKTLGP